MTTLELFLPILQIDESHNWVISDLIKTNDFIKVDPELNSIDILNNLIEDNFIHNDINDSFVTFNYNDIIICSKIDNHPTLILKIIK